MYSTAQNGYEFGPAFTASALGSRPASKTTSRFGYFAAWSRSATCASAYPTAPGIALTASSSWPVLDFSQRMTGEAEIRSRLVQLCDDCGTSVAIRRIL